MAVRNNTLQTPGKILSLEGLDGAGKSSFVPFIAELLAARGIEVVVTREPGGTPLGEKLRAILLEAPMHRDTEAMLMFAARREHMALVIEPALKRGAWVITDRFSDATFAYQCGGRGMSEIKCHLLEHWVHPGFQPDMTLLFDVPEAVAQERIGTTRALDKFEREKVDFHTRVRNAYHARAQAAPHRFRILDATRTMDQVREDLRVVIGEFATADSLPKEIRDADQPDDPPQIRVAKVLRDLVATIELHTDCMSGEITASALHHDIDIAEAELRALLPPQASETF